jgi:hypothetical protein
VRLSFPVSRLLLILAFVATVLSGGGVGRVVHSVVAHGGESCATADVDSCSVSRCESGQGATTHKHHDHRAPDRAPHDCPVCDELAVSNPAPSLIAPFLSVIEVLAIVHDREAAQLPAPDAPRVCAARPPPTA